MSVKTKEERADVESALSLQINEQQSSYENSRFLNHENERVGNVFIVKNSRYIKRESRDSRLFLSPYHDDYLVLKSEAGLVALLEREYALVETFDHLAEEVPKVRELTTRKIWKQDELKEKAKKLIEISVSFNVSLEKLKNVADEETRNLYARCEELREDIQNIEEQLLHIRTYPQNSPSKKLISLTHAELVQKSIPSREYVLSPWIPEASVSMLFAPPGIGKTNFGLAIAYAIASGNNFLHWRVPKARKVLYLDGEMHEADLQARIKSIEMGFDVKLPDSSFLRYINGTWQAIEMSIPDLSTDEGQEIIETQIGDVKFFVIDNLSTVCRTGNENESTSWAKMQRWLLSLRFRGIATLIIHHAGKSRDEGGIPIQRGSSMREVIMEAILALKRPKNYIASRGLVFEGHFLKARGFFCSDAEPFEATLEKKAEASVWTYRKLDSCNYERVLDLVNEGITSPKEIAEKLKISRQAVEKHLKRAKKNGDLP